MRCKRLFLYVYGAFVTRNMSTKTYGMFRIMCKKNVHIGNRCAFNPGVIIQGCNDVRIEDDVVLSPGVMLMDSGLDVPCFVPKDKRRHIDSFIRIKHCAWIGAGAIILPGVTIGEYSIVGAGSVVTKDVKPHTVVAGNPAKVIRKIEASQCKSAKWVRL